MSRKGRTLREQETIILWDNEATTASVYTHDQRIANKLKALSKEYPEEFVLEQTGPQRAVTYTIPKRYVGIRPPYSEERRQKAIADVKENGLPFSKEGK